MSSSSLPQTPHILACGHREIQSPRTALSFPAWLIQFSPSAAGGESSCCSYWRSKKDFLLLFRATKSIKKSIIPQCPKAALNKLVNYSPWRRPGYEGGSNKDLPDSCSTTNNYHVSMKRNVKHLDQYLQSISINFDCDNSDLSKAWCAFARPCDTDGLLPTAGILKPGVAGPNTMDIRQIKHGLTTSTSTQQGSRLGQYFCSNATAKQIVSLTLDFVKTRCTNEVKQLLFLEPSCGHGDIVWQLMEQLEAKGNSSKCDHRIIGCDLDSNAIRTCQEHVNSSEVTEWRRGDFLHTKPPPGHDDDSSLVVVLGGPPYTSGAGSGKNMQLDLPDAFLQHCAEIWKAAFVAFILPQRYRDRPISVLGWTVETHELETSTFYFQGERKVTQPSVIQCYTRKDNI